MISSQCILSSLFKGAGVEVFNVALGDDQNVLCTLSVLIGPEFVTLSIKSFTHVKLWVVNEDAYRKNKVRYPRLR